MGEFSFLEQPARSRLREGLSSSLPARAALGAFVLAVPAAGQVGAGPRLPSCVPAGPCRPTGPGVLLRPGIQREGSSWGFPYKLHFAGVQDRADSESTFQLPAERCFWGLQSSCSLLARPL